jgi:hypothetical protein
MGHRFLPDHSTTHADDGDAASQAPTVVTSHSSRTGLLPQRESAEEQREPKPPESLSESIAEDLAGADSAHSLSLTPLRPPLTKRHPVPHLRLKPTLASAAQRDPTEGNHL